MCEGPACERTTPEQARAAFPISLPGTRHPCWAPQGRPDRPSFTPAPGQGRWPPLAGWLQDGRARLRCEAEAGFQGSGGPC